MRILVKQSWLSVTAGLMYGLAWEPFGFWPLAVVGWAMWFSGLHDRDRSGIFLHSFLFALSAWLVAFHWVMAHPIPMAAVTSGVALVAYAAFFATLAAVIAPLAGSRRPLPPAHQHNLPARLLGGLVAALLFETALTHGPFAMPWLSAGMSTAPSSWAASVASWLGFQGAALFVLSCAAVLAFALATRRLSPRKAGIATGLVLLLLVLPSVHTPVALHESSADLQVRILEPDMSPDTWSNVHDTARIDSFTTILATARATGPAADITVLPETALPMADASTLHAWMTRLADAAGSPVLSGGIEMGRPEAPGRAFNIVLSSDEPQWRYAKRRLVPFAEHVPFSEWIPGFDRFSVPAGGVSSYQKGSELRPLKLGGQEIVPLVCFESLFGRDARHGLQLGGSILIVTTQDGWWGSDMPRRQHLAFSRMLAASTGRPVVHATVDGVSGLIDATGATVPLQEDSPQVWSGTLPLNTRTTLFMKVGYLPFFAIFAALIAVFVTQLWSSSTTRDQRPGPHS